MITEKNARIAPPEPNEYDLLARLGKKGVRLVVSPDGERVGVGKGQALLLSAEDRRAFARHRGALASYALLLEAFTTLCLEARALGLGPSDPVWADAVTELARAAHEGPLESALVAEDPAAVREALESTVAPVRGILTASIEPQKAPQPYVLGETTGQDAEKPPTLPGF